MRGRKPKPERLRVLHEDGRRVVGGGKPPAAPRWLTGEARAEWKRVVGELAKNYLVTTLDAVTLAAYCETFAQWRKAMRELADQGFTVPTATGVKANPLMKIAMGLVVEMRRMAAEFGFTPAARSRIVVPRAEGEEEDAFESVLDPGQAAAE